MAGVTLANPDLALHRNLEARADITKRHHDASARLILDVTQPVGDVHVIDLERPALDCEHGREVGLVEDLDARPSLLREGPLQTGPQ